MAAASDPLALELDRLALEFRHMLPGPAPAPPPDPPRPPRPPGASRYAPPAPPPAPPRVGPPPADPRDFPAALWGFLIAAALAATVVGLAVGAAIRRADGLPVLNGP